MVKHVIIWTLKPELTGDERESAKKGIKTALEGLKGQIDGLIDIRVETELLPTSTGDVMLDSTFTDAATLKAYAVHPAHVAAADGYVRPYTAQRSCVDFTIEK